MRTETAALAGLALVSALWERPRTVNVEKPEKGLNMSFSEKEPPDDSCPKPNPFLSLWGHLQDPQVAILWITGLIIGLLIISLGSALAPFFSAIVFAYMLEGMVNRLTRVSFPRWAAVTVVFLLFMSILVGLFLWLIPLLIEQLSALIAALPSMAKSLQNLAAELQTKYAKDLDPTYLQELIPRVTREMEQVARKIVTGSLAYLPGPVRGDNLPHAGSAPGSCLSQGQGDDRSMGQWFFCQPKGNFLPRSSRTWISRCPIFSGARSGR